MFFCFKRIPYKGMLHMLYQRKSKNRYFKDTFPHGGSTLVTMKKQDITTFAYYILLRILVTNKH